MAKQEMREVDCSCGGKTPITPYNAEFHHFREEFWLNYIVVGCLACGSDFSSLFRVFPSSDLNECCQVIERDFADETSVNLYIERFFADPVRARPLTLDEEIDAGLWASNLKKIKTFAELEKI